MKLALVTETFPPEINGVAMTLSQLVAGLREKGHAVQVVRPYQTGEARDAQADGENLIRVPGLPIPRYPDLRFGLPCGRQLRRAWSAFQPDIVHVATEGPLGFSAIRAAKRLGIATTSTFHTNFHSYSEHYNAKAATRLILAFLRWIHNQTQCTMAPTRELADELAAQGFTNMDVFARGVHLGTFNPGARDTALRADWGAGPDAPVFVHVSRLASEKNYELLQRTYAAILETNPHARFVIVGGGPLATKLQRQMPLAHFTGPIPLEERGQLARVYASADAFLYPSLTETYGNVTTEAMACGLAVVAYDYAAAAMHIRHESNGLLAPLKNESRFVELSLQVAADSELRKRLGAAAAKYAPAFSWQPVFDTFEAILQREIAARKTRSQ